ncbi:MULTISPECIES: App1 family protein [unclassified Zunongwangia]|uniref:App1 family protein n=1 Tax=unclassified Zunongwangia TaxID=2632541 RepID=UPI0022DE614C|nr:MULTISPECIES: App1 family protein [unclassified Zunongwangia]WBL21000.1 App1 family protein [Zunongwangia sp. HRR-M8]WBL27126.1 App1 family protein [Zunongwangia sp. HGR-M22]
MKLDLKLYRGYANDKELVVFGHLFKSWAPDKYRLDRKGIKHTSAIIHKFRIKPLSNYELHLCFKGKEWKTKTMEDGYFRFTVPYEENLQSGWHEYEVIAKMEDHFGIIEKGELLKPYESKLGIISDIDDTFLISHSNSFFKKLYVMLSKNVNRRKIFEDVVDHYKSLSKAGQDSEEASNSFFYVSSSEWNLYDFIAEFADMHELPKAVIKLKKIKTGISDFVKTGRGSHDHKFQKVKDIISFYPNLEYVLLGDDSQQDVHIYERICKTYPTNVRSIYIRQTEKKKNKEVTATLKNIESLDVATCYFKDSNTAIAHSEKINII